MSALPFDLYIVTFNCGRALLDIDAFSASLSSRFNGHDSLPDLVFLSLQEVAPIAYSFLGGALLAPYFARFVQAFHKAAGHGTYRHLITHNVGMTAIMVLAKQEESANVQWLQTAEAGVGWSECGNKGASAVRLGYAPSGEDVLPLTLVAAHLAPMEDAFERRNEDWENIVKHLAFKSSASTTASLSKVLPVAADAEQEPLLGSSPTGIPTKDQVQGMFVPQSPIFFAGDLNYRTSDTPPNPENHEMFPQPHVDRADARHFSHLLPQDQLSRERKASKTLHYLDEEAISFPPTYKFSEKQQQSMPRKVMVDDEISTWHWSSHRYPSWCDRILFSASLRNSDALDVYQYTALPIQPTSDHRPVALSCKLNLRQARSMLLDQSPPFPLSHDWESRRLAARRNEVVIGVLSYVGLTWEGNGLLLASAVGAIGGYLVLASMIST